MRAVRYRHIAWVMAAGLVGGCSGNLDAPDPLVGFPSGPPEAASTNGDGVVKRGRRAGTGLGETRPAPPDLSDLSGGPEFLQSPTGSEEEPGDAARRDKIEEVALSYGARAGVARRSYELAQQLGEHARKLDRLFDFRQLVITAPLESGVIMPPVVREADNALAIGPDGKEAQASDRLYEIVAPAEVRSSEPDWRQYLRRTWSWPEPPTKALWPQDEAELKTWRDAVANGWEHGRQQAERIFEADMARLVRDFTGVTRYHRLVEVGVLDAFYVGSDEVGVALQQDTLRIGERRVRILDPARFVADADKWRPVVVSAEQRPGDKDDLDVR